MPTIVPVEKQLEIVKGVWLGRSNIHLELVDHPSEDGKKALMIDAFTISEGDVEIDTPPSIVNPRPTKKIQTRGYHVDVTVHIPGTHEYPPDADVKDIGQYACFFEALTKVMELLAADAVRNVAESYHMDQMIQEEEKLHDDMASMHDSAMKLFKSK